MWHRVLAVGLLCSVLCAPGAAALHPEPAGESAASFPVAAKASLPIEFAVTARGETFGYPTYYYVYGYVRSLATDPVYSVQLEVDVTFYPYTSPGEPSLSSYTSAIPIFPALEATLPGQINPFSYSLTLGKASAAIGQVRAVAATLTSPSGATYVPLTVVDWHVEDTNVLGVVRNDHDRALHNLRVVVVEPYRCEWREATLVDTTLQPGQETAFQRNLYTTLCFTDNFVIVGQGATTL
jgi:hypothetical protein